jgi:hypothetical protein
MPTSMPLLFAHRPHIPQSCGLFARDARETITRPLGTSVHSQADAATAKASRRDQSERPQGDECRPVASVARQDGARFCCSGGPCDENLASTANPRSSLPANHVDVICSHPHMGRQALLIVRRGPIIPRPYNKVLKESHAAAASTSRQGLAENTRHAMAPGVHRRGSPSGCDAPPSRGFPQVAPADEPHASPYARHSGRAAWR